MKKLKGILGLLFVFSVMVMVTRSVGAYTKSNFSCTVTKLMDGESTHVTKYD